MAMKSAPTKPGSNASTGHRRIEAGLPFAVLVCGLVFSFYLVAQTRPEVFYSGDGGLKFLLTHQFASGNLHWDLRLPAAPWVRELWSEGFYPFASTVHLVGQRYFVGYPVFFPIVTAPWLAVLGHRGLYVVPMLAVWATWIVFLAACRRLEIGSKPTALGLFALAFSSPLTLYGAMYWEHTLGVALAFSGLVMLVDRSPARTARWKIVVGGALIGLSIWFRSELIVLLVVATVLALASPTLRLDLRHKGLLLLGVATALVPLIALNLLVYHHPLGPQALQQTADAVAGTRLENAANLFLKLGTLLVAAFPLTVPVVIFAISVLRRNDGNAHTSTGRFLLWVTLLFIATVSLVLPAQAARDGGGKQFGPRYLLATMPSVCLLAAIVIPEAWRRAAPVWRTVLAATVVVSLCLGTFLNTVLGSEELASDYSRRILPALAAARSHPAQVVVVAHQFVSQELAASLTEKAYFLARDIPELERVSAAVLKQGGTRFLLISHKDLTIAGTRVVETERGPLVMSISRAGTHGIYWFFDVSLASSLRH